MELIRLPFETAALTGFTHKAIVTYSDLLTYDGGSTTAVVPLVNARVGDVVSRAAFRLVTAFDFSEASVVVSMAVGDDGSTGRFIDAQNLGVDGTEILYYAGGAVATPLLPYAYITANAIDALFTASAGSTPLISEVTTGEVEIFLHICNIADLAQVTQPSAT